MALPPEEAQHAIRVMRIQPDDVVTLFDGRGFQCDARVVSLGRNECQCEVGDVQLIDREPECCIHFGVALPKPDRAKELIERLTELGVAAVTPIVGQRSQRPPKGAFVDKLRRGVVEACKQSGRNHLMEIRDTMSASDFFASVDGGVSLIAHPETGAAKVSRFVGQSRVTVAIGPEGGWSNEEVELAIGAGFECVDLGPRIYRIETAAVVVAAALVS
ncbi:Ribosomal RNA small subunit methyltransferase E [Rubripirellula tenax]|uniref:Ribosomal RNA small subunit methyltransferase E n=1 Tax=Rubripirellula tenax TaxID=2528015 RepID=A0A5C6EN14_9BACT|nr:Ribosomal RNA small subunit methyltransferase E [Rubripirellula tenax]